MPAHTRGGVGARIAYYRSVMRPKMTQQQLAEAACVALGTIRKIERGERGVGDSTLEAIAEALGVDPMRLRADRGPAHTPVHDALPALSAAIATYDLPEDGPARPLHELRAAVAEASRWRLGAQYTRIARKLPDLLVELARAYHQAPSDQRTELARLLVRAYRSADAVAYKFGARDLSARLIELMRWALPETNDPLLAASVAYVRTETFFAARAHVSGLRALEQALDAAPAPCAAPEIAARGALHMRAAVIAGRARDAASATTHLHEARALADRVPEDVYYGTAFGPDSVRIHEVSVAVSLGDEHVGRALDVAREWKPPTDLPAERRSGFYIELARAQLWSGRPDHAFESLKVARRIAPQHTREHPWVREDAATLRRLKRADSETLTNFAEWCAAT
ncbi:helix-turn-helix domain-containing protein [Streptomyces thermoviolaceus]|uniref:helix-turn-helix domain-containing protein n=2 Tax=Streptomyces TaxID=1883 RepID=UPI000F737557|nr:MULTISPECIES: helix-turn-helix transcriptional regulator [Streptomyces]MCM3266336.1 helix-turn-helix domain-containing protein [Streptomyces thermoviolaceus]RSR99028.1 XRE family transcriptional regulator [Streptomyces sp. WAC00469]